MPLSRELSQLASVITVKDTTRDVGINSSTPKSKLDVGGDVNISGVVTATSFSGDGSSLTSLNASNLGSGTIPDARFPATLPEVSGQNLTGLTGASAATYGAPGSTPVITVDSNGRITGISTAAQNSTTRTTTRFVATASQSSFTVSYSVGYVDVYLNGSKLDSTEYTATNGTSVSLTSAAAADDIVEFVAYENVSISSGSEAFKTISVSGQSDVVADSATDTLTLVAGTNMTITTNATGDSITFASSGGGSSGGGSFNELDAALFS